MMQLKQVFKTLRGQKVLQGVDLEIKDGERLVIMGRSGGGKSVLLRHMIGLMRPDKGEIWYHDQNIAVLPEQEIIPLRKDMGILFQNGALFDSLNVKNNIAFSMREEGKYSEEEISAEVTRALQIVDLPKQERKMPADLSGGMRKRVALARAVISRPKLMFYDEPTAGLDPIVSDSINKLILRLSKELNMTSVIVTHDMMSAFKVAERIAMLHNGKIYCIDTPEKIQKSEDPIIKNFVQGISNDSDEIF